MIWLKRSFIMSVLIIFSLQHAACLKTRAQLRDESEEREVAQPTAVDQARDTTEPKGQYAIDEIKSEITRLSGRMEELERGEASRGSSDSLKKLENRVSQIEQSQAALSETLAKIQDSSPLSDPNELFKKAKAQYEDQDFEAAAETLGHYLKIPKVKHPENAVFLRGEAFYKLKQYKKAIVEYSKFPEKYSHSTHVPEALFKIGASFDALGMKEDAKGFYQELVEKYPKSPEAKRARKKVK